MRSQIPFVEQIKRDADQIKRREGVQQRIDYFQNRVAGKEIEKKKLRDMLTERYEEEKEKKLDEEEIRKQKVADDFKATQL